jgi:GT2 family glycosyltransferase
MRNVPSERVSIVVLNWNTFDLTKACIDSLLRATYPHKEIILIDNASADGSGGRLRDVFPGITFIQNEKNLGFARGCNVGIRRALATGADYVLLLNSDATAEPGFLEPLVELANSDPSIGLISGKIRITQQPDRLWYAGARLSRLRGVMIDGANARDDGRFDRVREVGGCTGAMMFIRRRVLELVGMLPEEYFFGTEEWDYSLRVREGGFRNFYCPRSVVYHSSDGSHSNSAPKYLYSGFRNKLIFQERNFPRLLRPLWSLSYHIYAQYVAQFRLKLSAEDARAYKAAYRAAFRDHARGGRLHVEEEHLLDFEREYRAGPPRTDAPALRNGGRPSA